MRVLELLNACSNVTTKTNILVEDRERVLFRGRYMDLLKCDSILDIAVFTFTVYSGGIDIIVLSDFSWKERR